MTKTIDFFYAVGSPWAFLGLEPLRDVALRQGAAIRPRPILLIQENGGIFSKDRPEPRRRYWLRDLERWSRRRGKRLKMDGREGLSDPGPASLMVIAADLDGLDWFRLTLALQSALWQEAADIGRPEVRAGIAESAGLDGAALLAREDDADTRARWEQNRAEARALGIFGVPTFLYEGELYWGQDTLDFLEDHLAAGQAVA